MESENTNQPAPNATVPQSSVGENSPVLETPPTTRRMHGSKPPRGLVSQPHSPSLEGRFGRMFRTLVPAHFPDEELVNIPPEERPLAKLAEAMTSKTPVIPEGQINDEDNQGIDAGYTYLGQFIDHDLTFDPASSLQKLNDPQGLVDYRTPRFDLDSLYGRGPDDQPYLYEDDGIKMLLGGQMSGGGGASNDLPRNARNRALIGDPRNDENVIISQLHATMLQFHNRMADILREQGESHSFEDVQQAVRWHYQWVVLHDFLPTIVEEEVIAKILRRLTKENAVDLPTPEQITEKPTFRFFKWKKDPYIPVEFSVAAYRYGHSMVRSQYRLNSFIGPISIFGSNPFNSLEGFRVFPSSWAIDWSFFFSPTNTSAGTTSRVQKSYKIDTSLTNPLGSLPASTAGTMPSLAKRNLVRGNTMGLPSGQSVAKHMGFAALTDDQLKVGKATEADTSSNQRLVDIDSVFKGKAPLWYYILAEAQSNFNGTDDNQTLRLGPVGGTIVAEVIIGLMHGDPHSYLSQNPAWKPILAFCNGDKGFKMIDLLTIAKSV